MTFCLPPSVIFNFCFTRLYQNVFCFTSLAPMSIFVYLACTKVYFCVPSFYFSPTWFSFVYLTFRVSTFWLPYYLADILFMYLTSKHLRWLSVNWHSACQFSQKNWEEWHRDRGSAPSSHSCAISSSLISISSKTTGLTSPSHHHRAFRRHSVATPCCRRRHAASKLPPPSHCRYTATAPDAAAAAKPRRNVLLPPPPRPPPLRRRSLVGCCVVVRRPILSLHAVMQHQLSLTR